MKQVESLERVREDSPHPMLRFSKKGYLLYANAAAGCVMGALNCKIGQALPNIWHDAVLETLRSGKRMELEMECGSSTYALTLVPTPDAKDVNVYGTDITAHKFAEEALGALRESEERHRALVQSSSDAILVVDKNRRILSFNSAFLDLLGLTREEAEGQSTRIIHPSDESFSAFGEKAFAAVKASGTFRAEWEFVRKDGTTFPVEETFSPIRTPKGDILGYVVIIRDISETIEAQRDLAAYREHLEEMIVQKTREVEDAYKSIIQEEKLRILGSISAQMAHEIRNPLMAIGGFARRLQAKTPGSYELEIIVQESSRLEQILKRIEDYLRPFELQPKGCSVNDIIGEAVELVSTEIDGTRVDIETRLAPALSLVYVDHVALLQVLINIIHDAAKVMQKDAKITFETSESGQNVQISIRTPIRPEVKDTKHIFIPIIGETGKEISVPLCFKILREMGGHLSLIQQDESLVLLVSLPKAVQQKQYDKTN